MLIIRTLMAKPLILSSRLLCISQFVFQFIHQWILRFVCLHCEMILQQSWNGARGRCWPHLLGVHTTSGINSVRDLCTVFLMPVSTHTPPAALSSILSFSLTVVRCCLLAALVWVPRCVMMLSLFSPTCSIMLQLLRILFWCQIHSNSTFYWPQSREREMRQSTTFSSWNYLTLKQCLVLRSNST